MAQASGSLMNGMLQQRDDLNTPPDWMGPPANLPWGGSQTPGVPPSVTPTFPTSNGPTPPPNTETKPGNADDSTKTTNTNPTDQSGGGPAPDYLAYNKNTGMPPWLADIYNQAGVKALDAGTGFKDWRYWSDKQDQADRLKADLAGRGPDQPGPGDWGNTSGRGGSGSGAPTSLGSMGNLMSMMLGPTAMGYNAFGPQGNQIPYDSSMGVPSSNPGDYPVNFSNIPLAGSTQSGSGTPSQHFDDSLSYHDQGTGQDVTSNMSSTLMRQLLGSLIPGAK